MVQSYVDQVGAKRGMAVVMDVQTGEVYSLATYQPGVDAGAQSNMAVSQPFEPGSVNKVVTFAAALEAGLITPTSVSTVDGEIEMGGSIIHDAWEHGPIEMTATGILAKSSNVGTLQIAQQLGPDVFAAELRKFGLGQTDRHRAVRRVGRPGAGQGPMVVHHLRQPADRPGSVDEPGPDGVDVPGHRQRRREDGTDVDQGHHHRRHVHPGRRGRGHPDHERDDSGHPGRHAAGHHPGR